MVKPFKLDNLEKVSKHEVEVVKALYEFLPATDVRDKLHVAIRKSLMKQVGQDIRYFLSRCETGSFSDFVGTLPSTPVLVVLGLTPIERKAIIQIDQNIASLVINKLLSGEVEVGDVKPLTETEQGVLQYLVMQVLNQIYKVSGSEPRTHFRFERFIFDPSEVRKISSPKERVCMLTVDVSFSDQAGFVKLVFPDPFIEEMVNLSIGAGRSRKEKAHFARQLRKWGFLKTSVWAEAGNCLLSPVEIKDLEAGDVILFDETDLSMKGKKVAGKVMMHFGGAEAGVQAGLIESDPKSVKCKLNSIVK